jgi:hypothetical protein
MVKLLTKDVNAAQRQAVCALSNIQNVIEELNSYAGGADDDLEELLEQRIKAQENERFIAEFVENSEIQKSPNLYGEDDLNDEHEQSYNDRIEKQEAEKQWQPDSTAHAENKANEWHVKIQQKRDDLIHLERREKLELQDSILNAEENFLVRQVWLDIFVPKLNRFQILRAGGAGDRST